MERTGSRFLLASMFLALAAVVLLAHVGTAAANVPTVLQIVNISQGSDGRIRLEITHSYPSPNHYVDLVEVQVDGATQQFTLQPQTTDPFTVELELGALQGTPEVSARAHCNLHGWSDWSQTISVPEFPTEAIVALTVLLTMVAFRAGFSRIRESPD